MLLSRTQRIWFVNSISLARLLAILLFAALASAGIETLLLLFLYGFAAISDSVDGYVSRRFGVATYFGNVLDLVSDKSLTAVSLLYAATHGMDLLPLAIIVTRDTIMLGMRLITAGGTQLLPTSRLFGGIMATLVWGNTFILIYQVNYGGITLNTNLIYWVCSMVFMVNLIYRIHVSAPRIKTIATSESE